MRKLTKLDYTFIDEHEGNLTFTEIASMLSVSKSTVSRYIKLRNSGKKLYPSPTEEDEKMILEMINRSLEEIVDMTGFSISTVKRVLDDRRFIKHKKFSDVEIAYIRENYGYLSNKEIANRLRSTPKSIANFASKLGISSMKWESWEERYLTDNIGKIELSVMAERLSRSEKAVVAHAIKMGYLAIDFTVVNTPSLKISSHKEIKRMKLKEAKYRASFNVGRSTSSSSKRYTREEEIYLMDNSISNAEAAIRLGRSEAAIASKRHSMKKIG